MVAALTLKRIRRNGSSEPVVNVHMRPTLLPRSATTRARLALSVALLLNVACSKPSRDTTSIFGRNCAGCHEGVVAERAPTRRSLAQLPPDAILIALETGSMRAMGTMLTRQERREVAEYITGTKLSSAPTPPVQPGVGACAPGVASRRPLLQGPQWLGWGVDLANSRYQPGEMAGLTRDDLSRLTVKWAFGSPGSMMARSQVAVSGDRVFLGSYSGVVYSLDAATGCIIWTFEAEGAVRTSINIARLGGPGLDRTAAFFGDLRGNVYAVDALTGKELWRTEVDAHPWAMLTAAPTLFEKTLYVPVSSNEELASMNPAYPCCTFRGSVVALDIADGHIRWKTFMSADTARRTGTGSQGVETWGPSGAAIWSSPTIDTLRRVAYVTTGNSYSDPMLANAEAIVALDLASGKVVWANQMTPGPAWNFSCISASKSTCPLVPGPDFDFGAPAILRTLSDGHRLLIAGQKSGILHAVDPDREGAIVWQARLGRGGERGSIVWGPAADTATVYVALSVVDTLPAQQGGGVYAIRMRDGARLWYTASPAAECTRLPGCSGAQSAALTLIPGVLFSGSRDGHLRAYSTDDGSIIWDLNTLPERPTVNGVRAHGGSLNAAGVVVVGGRMFVRSGYGFGGMPGNILLALEVGKP